ncbi:MAG: D-lyxose/D-mannose family sugar isomerase [Christensenellaceae bacterium]
MKRSEINKIMQDALEFMNEYHFALPEFAYWTPNDWKTKGHEYDEIRDNMLGWDITDFGAGDFKHCGLVMFTIRNGNFSNKKYKKTYAEKLLISDDRQVTPYHFHWKKMEDIINRGGGTLVIKCYNSEIDGKMLNTPVKVNMDGREYMIDAGEEVRIEVGQSITLPMRQYHSFWSENGKTLIGEVSCVNDDTVDNRFFKKTGRFPKIEENEAILYYLGNEYPNAE